MSEAVAVGTVDESVCVDSTGSIVFNVQKERISRFNFQEGKHTVLIKNDRFIDDITVYESDKGEVSPMTNMEILVMQVAFFMAHQANQQNLNYDANTDFVISLRQFAELLGVHEDPEFNNGSFHTQIRRAIKRVDARRFFYPSIVNEPGYEGENLSGLFGSISFVSSQARGKEISFQFPKTLIPYLKNYGRYTWFYFANVVALQKYRYALLLYELLSSKKNQALRVDANTIPVNLSLDRLRKYMGVSDSYNTTDMIRKIVSPSIEQINTKTTMTVELKGSRKKGRNLDQIDLEVRFEDVDLDIKGAMSSFNETKPFMTERQIALYAKKLAKDVAFCSVYKEPDEETKNFAHRIAGELSNNLKVLEFYEYLKNLGYASKRVEKMMKEGSGKALPTREPKTKR